MIYAMARDVARLLDDREIPVVVQYGPDRFTRSQFSSRIQLEIEENEQPPVFVPRGHKGRRQPMRAIRRIPVLARVSSESTVDAARVGEHESELIGVTNALIAAVYDWSKAAKVFPEISFSGIRWLPRDEHGGAEVFAGRKCEVRFSVGCGVYAAAKATATVAKTETDVRVIDHDGNPVSTGVTVVAPDN